MPRARLFVLLVISLLGLSFHSYAAGNYVANLVVSGDSTSFPLYVNQEFVYQVAIEAVDTAHITALSSHFTSVGAKDYVELNISHYLSRPYAIRSCNVSCSPWSIFSNGGGTGVTTYRPGIYNGDGADCSTFPLGVYRYEFHMGGYTEPPTDLISSIEFICSGQNWTQGSVVIAPLQGNATGVDFLFFVTQAINSPDVIVQNLPSGCSFVPDYPDPSQRVYHCDVGAINLGSTATLNFTIMPLETGTLQVNVSDFHLDQVGGAGVSQVNGTLTILEAPPIEPCYTAGTIEVCADDFAQTGANEYTATENIRLGAYGRLNGTVTVNTADDSIATDGVLRYRLESGQNIGLVEGEYLFDSADTADGVLTIDPSLASDVRFNAVAEILFTSDSPDLFLDVDGDLVAQGGTLQLNSPYPTQFALTEYRIAPDGTRTGSAAPFTLNLAPSALNADTPIFTDEGLVVSGTVGLPYLLPTAVNFSGLLITSADLSASTQLNAGLDFSAVGEINLGVAALSLGTAGFEVGDFRGQGTELTFTVSDAGLVLSSALFDGVLEEFTLTVEGLRLFDDTFQFETLGASVKLPPISLYGFKLNDVEVAVELRGMTSIAFEGSGTLEVPNFIRASKSDAVGITVALKFYNDNDGIHWEQLGAGMNGLEIPLGLTPVTLTSFGGNVVIDEDEDTATLTGSAGVDISPTGFKTLVGVATLTGNVALTVNTGGWGELAGDLQLFGALQAANAAFSINKPGESVGGVRGTVVINALEILEGTLSLFIGMDAPYVEGTGTVTAVIPFSQLPTWLAVLFDVESDIPLGAVQAYLGKVGERYGIGANVTLLDEEFGLFINSSLGVSVQHGWFTVQPGGQRSANGFSLTRHIETGVPDGFRAAGALPQSAVEVISVGVPAEADAVAFTLNTQGNPKLGVQLIDPNGVTLTVASEGSYAGLQAGQKNGIITLMISDPLAGAWQMRVTGVTSTSVYQTDVLGSLERPTLTLEVTPQGQAWQITWDGCGGLTNPASFDLYYDTDAANYDGAPIAADVTDCQWMWDGQDAPSGTYSLYVVGRYADDLPVMSNYSAFVTVNNAAAPATPTGLTAKADADSIVLTWFPNFEPDLAGYQVEITSSANAGWVETLTTPDNRLTLNRPDLLQTYTLRVLASDTSGNQSAYSSPVSVTPSQMDDLTPPDAPVLVGVGSSSDKLLVTWLESGAPDVAGYLIEYDFGTAGSFTACCEFQGGSPLDVGMSTSHMLTFYDGGRTVLVRVRAYDASGNRSAPSAVMSAVTPTVTPLLVNGGFETAKGAARYADKWAFKGGTATKRVCNKVGIPGKPDKIFSFEGDCAVQLKSATGAAKAIQKLTVSGMSVGDSVRFIGNFMGKGAVKNATVKIKMVSAGGVAQTLTVVYATAGNNNTYGTASNQAVLTIAPAKITVTLSYTGLKGAVLADNLRLQWIK